MNSIKNHIVIFILILGVNSSVFSQNEAPVAVLGYDTVVLSEIKPVKVVLESDSYDTDGDIVQYLWQVDNDTVGTDPTLEIELSALETVIRLTVVDDSSATDSDEIKVFLGSPTNNGLNRIPHREGAIDLFASGMNIAWYRYAADLEDYDDDAMLYFTELMDSIASNNGNALRWWLHTNGANTPIVNDDGFVEGINFESIQNMKHVMDLAFDKNISLSMCLWSFDMLQNNQGQDPQVMKKLLEDSVNVQSYIDNALLPILELLGDHPAVFTWEIFNEPEGMTNQFGWTTGGKVDISYVQRFVNLCAGAIHRKVPGAMVSNGTWSFRALSDINGNKNYYADEELIAAGGDPDGTLDFYQVHYYPEHFGNDFSPFHRPAEYWQLDKPIVIGEFPADTVGHRANPAYSIEKAYELAVAYGYAGVMSWSWSSTSSFNRDFSGTTARGLKKVHQLIPEALQLHHDTIDIDRIPKVVSKIRPYRTLLEATSDATPYQNLSEVFLDEEDGGNLNYSIVNVSTEAIVQPTVSDGTYLNYIFETPQVGTAEVEIKGEDSGGWYTTATGLVMVGSNDGQENNLAFYKEVMASNELNEQFAVYANDGNGSTYWQTRLLQDQWLEIDMGASESINYINIDWGSEYASAFDIAVSDDQVNWEVAISETAFNQFAVAYGLPQSISARYVRINLHEAATNNGLRINEVTLEHVSDNQPPVVKSFVEDYIVGLSQVRNFNNYIRFSDIFDDEHRAALQYEITNSNASLVTADYSNGGIGISLIFTEGAIGQSDITITAIDPFGLETSTSFKIEVFDDILGTSITKPKMLISPNPASMEINISTSNHERVRSVSIFNLEGKLIKHIDLNPSGQTIDISDLHTGIYLLEAHTDHQILKSRLIKE